MRTTYDDTAQAFEHCVGEALFLDKCARAFARTAHGLKAAGKEASAAMERHRARVYRHKAHKQLNAARQYVPH